uniref:Uncharacterized protein n=1 Tax=Palpitomonas bilix TaxID=652834 RepID=A0A7S3GDS2_9EUKA
MQGVKRKQICSFSPFSVHPLTPPNRTDKNRLSKPTPVTHGAHKDRSCRLPPLQNARCGAASSAVPSIAAVPSCASASRRLQYLCSVNSNDKLYHSVLFLNSIGFLSWLIPLIPNLPLCETVGSGLWAGRRAYSRKGNLKNC